MSANMKNIMAMISNSNTDAVIDALDKFCEMIKELDNIDEITAQKEIFKATFKVSALKSAKGTKRSIDLIEKKDKKKRAPSMFNLYVKYIMPSLKQGSELKSNELMSKAAEIWKNNTDPFGVFVKENTKTFKKCFPSLEVAEVFQKMRTCFDEGGEIPEAATETTTSAAENTDGEVAVAPPVKKTRKVAEKKKPTVAEPVASESEPDSE